MQRLIRNICFLFFFLWSVIPVGISKELVAQQRVPQYYKLSKQQGLSSNLARSVIQDREGFYWIATADGLNRFDGTSFKIFRYDDNDGTTISHNLCRNVLEGKDGDIWVGTQKGVSRYQKKTGKFRRYFFHHPKFNDDVINTVFRLVQDLDGNIWVANYGLWKINPETHEIRSYNYEDSGTRLSDASQISNAEFDGAANGIWVRTGHFLNFFSIEHSEYFNLNNNPFKWKVFELENNPPVAYAGGSLWIYSGHENKILKFNAKENSLTQMPVSLEKRVLDLSGDDNGNLLIRFTGSPAMLYSTSAGTLEQLISQPEAEFFPEGTNVLSFYTDAHESRWLCTRKGVYVFPQSGEALQVYKLPATESVTSFRSVIAVNDSVLYIGTRNELIQYNPLTGVVNRFKEKEFDAGITSFLNAGDSVLWIATGEPALIHWDLNRNRIIRKKAIPGLVVFLIGDRLGSVWVGSWSQGLFEMDGEGRLLSHFKKGDGFGHRGNFVGGFYDKRNELWMGLNGGDGFTSVDIDRREFSHYKIASGKGNDFDINTVTAIAKDNNKNIWLGTHGSGLFLYDRSKEAFLNYNRNSGLAGDFINTLAFDHSGRLWISHNNGIDILHLRDTVFSHVNALLEADDYDYINNLSVLNNKFYYISNRGVTVIDTDEHTNRNKKANIILSSIRVAGEEIFDAPKDNLVLSHNRNSLGLEFSSLKVSPDIPAEYKYKLVGLDPEWNYSGNRGVINYTNIPPGKYELLLNATNEGGIWNDEPFRVMITVTPPYWKTWWFFLLASGSVISIITFLIRYRFRQIRKAQQKQLALVVATQEKEKKNISSQLHDDLGVRLSALKYFVTSLKPHLQNGDSQAEAIYDKTLSAIDGSVDDIRYLLINLSPKTLNEYGYLMAVEDLVNKLRRLHIIQIELRQSGLEQRLDSKVESGLYRITQELINNTLKHAGASRIRLNIEKKNDNIELSYSDDGKGFELREDNQGYGLENIMMRVTLLNGKLSWKYVEKKVKGVDISIPVNHT
ncbi:MAG: hypothetical protein J5I50_09090 [Chitinophagaceae bacterium]|nr:hypothetical protein [Chitinophagaceae bacterium]